MEVTLWAVQLVLEFFQPALCIREVHLVHHQQGRLGEQLLLVQLQLLHNNNNNTGGVKQEL